MQRGAPTPRQLVSTRAAAIWWVVGLVILDRAIKFLAQHLLAAPRHGLFFVAYTLNAKGPLSMPLPVWLLVVFGLCAVAAALMFAISAWRAGHVGVLTGLALVLGGGLSNLADRLVYGGVIDLFHLTWWGTLSFNLADVELLAGVVTAVVCLRPAALAKDLE